MITDNQAGFVAEWWFAGLQLFAMANLGYWRFASKRLRVIVGRG